MGCLDHFMREKRGHSLAKHLISLPVFMGVHVVCGFVHLSCFRCWFLFVHCALSSFVLSYHNLVLSFGFWASDFPSVLVALVSSRCYFLTILSINTSLPHSANSAHSPQPCGPRNLSTPLHDALERNSLKRIITD